MGMKVERNRGGNKYTFIPEDKKDEMFLDRIAQLEEENKKLKEENKELKEKLEEADKYVVLQKIRNGEF